jgi:hypothetical protein
LISKDIFGVYRFQLGRHHLRTRTDCRISRDAKGAVHNGVKEERFKSGEQWEVLRRQEELLFSEGTALKNSCHPMAPAFSVFVRQKITLSIGDRIRFTENVKRREHKFVNEELRTVIEIDEGKIIFDKGEIIRNGAALHLDQGLPTPF